MEPVRPDTGADELVVARDQKEYLPYPAAMYSTQDDRIVLVSRWRFTDEEREAIARGEDLFVGLITDGNPVQPMFLEIGGRMWTIDAKTKFICPSCHEKFESADDCKQHIRDGGCSMIEATEQNLSLL